MITRETTAVVAPGHSLGSVSELIASVGQRRDLRAGWVFFLALSVLLLELFFVAVAWLLFRGVGIWGVNIPVAWGFAITNFVWWIGIGHAGTFISAFLLLMRKDWRTSINRFAEAMTLFAVACAGLFPLLHLGRPWFFYWLFPYPDTMTLWPQFRSPLVWDVFAVSTYATVSLLFWYVGLVPDLSVYRDSERPLWVRKLYGVLALGWRGSASHWQTYEKAYLLMAGLATPLVISVHSIVSLDFTVAIVPGWHSTIFPPYFVAGAIFSGFAMVLSLAIPLRWFYDLEDFITLRHLENAAKLMLATGWIVIYGYAMEAFTSWYSGDPFEWYMTVNRALGAYRLAYWVLVFCNVALPQLLWIKGVRQHPGTLFAVALAINCGMWVERFVIVVTSLHRDFMPSIWRLYVPTFWDWATLGGSLGLFFVLFALFVRLFPVVSIAEMQKLVAERAKRRAKERT